MHQINSVPPNSIEGQMADVVKIHYDPITSDSHPSDSDLVHSSCLTLCLLVIPVSKLPDSYRWPNELS